MSPKKEILVGVFIIVGVLLFAAGLFLIGSRKQLFAHHYTLYTDFDKIDTLTSGAKVRVSGMDAGEVTDIQVPNSPSSRFRFKLEVDQKFRGIIRQNSVVSIETEGMVGNKFLNIQKGGENSPECPPGGTLPSKEPFELSDLMRQGSGLVDSAKATIDDIRMQSDHAIKHITTLVGHVDSTVEGSRKDVKSITSNSAQLTENANAIVSSIRAGQGAAGKLLEDKTVASNLSETVANAKSASDNAKEASEKANAMTAQLDRAVTTFLKSKDQNENTASRLRDTVEAANEAATNVRDDSEAIKHNFFLRGFFKRRGFYNLDDLTPEKYGSTEFVKKPRVRIWTPSAGLFDSHADGTQGLSKDGQAILDQDMSEVVRYLPNNPIMVEGYSSQGTPDEKYMSSRQRAIAVRDYLESHFHIDRKFVGIMPLRDHPPRGAGRETWDGVCLVVVLSK
ncbi:MAG TPA: MlaD family protein [Terriglobia bacterium]|nr:MlaD family protein [Terriglobia bacterium]